MIGIFPKTEYAIESSYSMLYNTTKEPKEGCPMLAVNYSTYRSHLKDYCDQAVDDAETVIVTRKDERNVVMMSLEAYNNLMENFSLMSNRSNYRHIMKGIHELEAGKSVTKSTDELERLTDE